MRLSRGGPRRALSSRGDPRGQDRQLPPLPADLLERQPADSFGTPGPYEDAVQNTPIFEENGLETFKGIDIMRTAAELRPLFALRRSHVSGSGPRSPAYITGRCSVSM